MAKQKYKVYLVGHGSGCFARDYCKDLIGETLAVSPKQAVNNISFREGLVKEETVEDSMGLGTLIYRLEAEAV